MAQSPLEISEESSASTASHGGGQRGHAKVVAGCRVGWACDDFFEDILCRILASDFRQPVSLLLTP